MAASYVAGFAGQMTTAREVRLRGERVALSQEEFALLLALAAEPTRVFTRGQ